MLTLALVDDHVQWQADRCHQQRRQDGEQFARPAQRRGDRRHRGAGRDHRRHRGRRQRRGDRRGFGRGGRNRRGSADQRTEGQNSFRNQADIPLAESQCSYEDYGGSDYRSGLLWARKHLCGARRRGGRQSRQSRQSAHLRGPAMRRLRPVPASCWTRKFCRSTDRRSPLSTAIFRWESTIGPGRPPLPRAGSGSRITNTASQSAVNFWLSRTTSLSTT